MAVLSKVDDAQCKSLIRRCHLEDAVSFLFAGRENTVLEEKDEEYEMDWRPVVQVAATALQYYAAVKVSGVAPLLSGPSVLLSCIPIIVPFTSPWESVVDLWPITERATKYQKMLAFMTVTQGSLGVFELLLGDLLGGFIGCVLAAVGQRGTTPGGVGWVPTYAVLSFINGSISVLSLAEKAAFSKFPIFALSNPTVVNVVHAVVVANPILSMAGVYYAYRYLAELRCMNSDGTMMETPTLITSGSGMPGPLAPPPTRNYVPFAGDAHTL